jgi:hypothetical protein
MTLDPLLRNEGAHVEHLDIIGIVKIVTKVKLIDAERHNELRNVWWKVRSTHQREFETWPFVRS